MALGAATAGRRGSAARAIRCCELFQADRRTRHLQNITQRRLGPSATHRTASWDPGACYPFPTRLPGTLWSQTGVHGTALRCTVADLTRSRPPRERPSTRLAGNEVAEGARHPSTPLA